MKYIVKCLAGFDGLNFGMTMPEVRSIISGKLKTFNRYAGMGVADEDHLTDAYQDRGIYCHYDAEGIFEAVNFFLPARPLLNGVDILSLRTSEAIAFLKRLDPALVVENNNAVSSRFSLGVVESSEADDDEDAPLESFYFGRAGYYS